VPLLSGFFSKDEILYRTYASGHTLLWSVGLVTSFLTAIYMFRLVFLTFHGERADHLPSGEAASPVAHPEPAGAADLSGPGGHGSHLHDAPFAMAFALVVLAAGSALAGYAGLPRVLGGANRFERFLDSSLTARQRADATPAGAAAAVRHSTGEESDHVSEA